MSGALWSVSVSWGPSISCGRTFGVFSHDRWQHVRSRATIRSGLQTRCGGSLSLLAIKSVPLAARPTHIRYTMPFLFHRATTHSPCANKSSFRVSSNVRWTFSICRWTLPESVF